MSLIEDIGFWGSTLKSVSSEILGKSPDKIKVPINSYGGEVLEALAIYNYLKGRDAEVEAHIVGFALSAGTVVASAADKVTMSEHGYYMIHNPWVYAAGEAKDLENMAQLMNSMTDELAMIFSKKTGKDVDEIKQMMDDETWMTAQEALDHGFVDEITPSTEILNSANKNLLVYNKVPEAIKNILNQKNSDKMNEEKFKEQKTSILDEVSTQIGALSDSIGETITNEIKKIDFTESITTAVTNALDPKIQVINDQIEEVKNSIPEGLAGTITELQTQVKNMGEKVEKAEQDVANALALEGKPGQGAQVETPAEKSFNNKARQVANPSKY